MSSGLLQRRSTASHSWTGVAASLGGGEMIAEPMLHLGDTGAERCEIALDQRRHDLHQNEPTNMSSFGFGKRGQGRKGLDLLCAMNAFTFIIEDQQDTPFLREAMASDDGRKPAIAAAAGIENHAA